MISHQINRSLTVNKLDLRNQNIKNYFMLSKSQLTSLLLLLVAVGSFLQSCSNSDAREEEGSTASESAPAVEAFTLERGNISSSIQIPGELIAFQQVDLYAKINSFVKKLNVDVGSEVKAGQLLVTLEAPEINAQLSGAESRLKSQEAVYLASKARYDRLLKTSETPGTISQNDLDQAFAKQQSDLAQWDASKAAYREIVDTRNYLEIRAPFEGVITSRNVSTGAYVGPSGRGSEMPIFTLQEQSHLRLVVSVPESYVGYINNESEVNFTVRAFPNQQFKAKVARLAGALDAKLRAQRTEMDVMNEDKKLLPGMVAEVSIPLNSNGESFVVPASAVLNSTEGVFLIKVENNQTQWVPVTKGRSDGNKTEIFGELSENDTFITHASEEIRNAAPIENVRLDSTDDIGE